MSRLKQCYSGIGGQAVLEGVMMKNGEKYAVAVRKPDGSIAVDIQSHNRAKTLDVISKIPFVRGVFNFFDSLVLGMKALNYSASFYDEEEGEATGVDKALDKVSGGKAENVLSVVVMLFSIALALGFFIVLPYYISSLLSGFIRNASLMALIEGILRLVIFLGYILAISLMKDIRRLYMYHGAEHKCINCIERGKPLTVKYVKNSSRYHKRCGTSFVFFVMLVSIILFFFIRVDQTAMKVFLRILLMPAVAGISYEIIRFAGRSDNLFVTILSAPGKLIQRITTKEPDETMIEVAIASVEAVFDWRVYLKDNFGYEFTGEE